MNEAIAFDTHRYIKHLTQTGFTEEQAEALAEEQVLLLNSSLVTKNDLTEVEAGLKADIAQTNEHIAQIEASLKVEMAQTNEHIAQIEASLKVEMAQTNERIAQVEASLKVEMAQTNERIAQVETRLVKWVVGAGIAVVATQAALLIKLL